MEKTFNRTQCMAFAHLHNRMMDFLFNYAEGKLDRMFFINGMTALIGQIDNLIRENGHYSCSYSRMLDEKLVTEANSLVYTKEWKKGEDI